MAGLVFDTHKAVKALREAGADEPLAEAVVVTIGDAFGENIATRADLGEVKTELKADVAAVRVDLAEMETRLYRHLWAMAAGIVGLTVSLTVALVKLTS